MNAAQFVPYYGTGQRIKVTTTYPDGSEWTRTGWVSRSTGEKPVFLLMHRANSISSRDTLSADDKIVAVQENGRYMPV